jgi:hypothetical protein
MHDNTARCFRAATRKMDLAASWFDPQTVALTAPSSSENAKRMEYTALGSDITKFPGLSQKITP